MCFVKKLSQFQNIDVCTWISGRNECAESETVEPREEGEVREDLNEAEHDAANNERRDGCANKRQSLEVHKAWLKYM